MQLLAVNRERLGKQMTVESQPDIDGILHAGRVVARVRDAMLSAVEPGMTSAELDKLGG